MSIVWQNNVMDTTPPNRRRVSPMGNLDRDRVQALADLHPWNLKKLCEISGLETTTLSHFFAGRRPLPLKKAYPFLGLLGLGVNGEFDRNHCFILSPKFGQEEIAQRTISLLFPEGGKRFDLNTDWINRGKAQWPESERARGSALYDGQTAAVLHSIKEDESEGIRLNPKIWKNCGFDSSAEILLSLDLLPKKADVVAAFTTTDADFEQVEWKDVIDVAKERGVTPEVVLNFVINQKRFGV